MRFSTVKVALLFSLATSLVLWSSARADWNLGDPHKMHFPQLPDPFGWDVNMAEPKVLADDFLCTETGPIRDIHFWFSIRQDNSFILQQLLNNGIIHASIHDDIPAGTGGIPWSRPGPLLWERDFLVGTAGTPGAVTIRPWHETGQQGWYDPNPPQLVIPGDHFGIWQANITEILQPFEQQAGRIYWLDLSVNVEGIGWKTSREHFNDDAVWNDFPPHPFFNPDWHELRDPFTGQSLDLAFVVTPEPGTFLAAMGVVSLLLVRRRVG